ncbi:LysM peptidoglycan-binding domain-containing protein [Desulfallas thermosapovorans]|uniref:LysM repeat protein n=1 Tax=Desulfallas thermosapovorans DSM 6562 TaxID=1121431 RepID=A0A5S4ZW53_9FIRM|nr:LysM peptidoglycan-binding domain-containing protein [Desulfallas thermosapovorans]TYO97026.1 LysM repeat protein [Desulfallas thermosapovorans DSM 6562]
MKNKMLLPGLLLLLLFSFSINPAWAAEYTVTRGDSLWTIAQKNNTSVAKLMEINNLKSDFLTIGQVLKLDNKVPSPTNQSNNYTPGNVYLIQAGDTLSGIAQRFGLTVESIRRLNNIQGDMIYAGQKLLLNSGGSVSRGSVERPGITEMPESGDSSRYGRLVDWFSEGKNLLKPGMKFNATDIQTGKTIQLAVLSSGNHCDVEPLTQEDTNTMLSLFKEWTWTPRPVCIQVGGQAIAASLSGMPHTNIENITGNGVTGHFDMYLFNSEPHGSGISKSYVQQHHDAVQMAAK